MPSATMLNPLVATDINMLLLHIVLLRVYLFCISLLLKKNYTFFDFMRLKLDLKFKNFYLNTDVVIGMLRKWDEICLIMRKLHETSAILK